MRMPRKMGPQVYRQMLETRYDPQSTSRWRPILEEMARDTPPPAREQKRPNALLRNPFRR